MHKHCKRFIACINTYNKRATKEEKKTVQIKI